MAKKVLGRGLDALIPQGPPPAAAPASGGVTKIPVDSIRANPHQPREVFDPERLRELARSIEADGVLQPVVVRRAGEGYELIMGERRLQAARMAGVKEIPAVVRESVRDRDALRLALVENIQRENLNPVEVARAYRQLVAEYGYSQQELADVVGRDRSSVANTIRLLNLPDDVQNMIADGRLSAGHARALLALPTRREQSAMARRIVERGMSVRDAEAAVGIRRERRSRAGGRKKREKPVHIADLERAFSSHLGTRVEIQERRGGRGRITIEFYSNEEFERIAEQLGVPLPR